MKQRLCLLLLAVVVLCDFARAEIVDRRPDAALNQECYRDVCFPSIANVGASQVPLLGLGRLRYLFFKVYTAALYGPPNARSTDAILADVPKRLVIRYHRSIDKEKFAEVAEDSLKDDPAVDLNAVSTRLAQLNSALESVQEGDTYEMAYIPGQGTTLSRNGSKVITIAGLDFAQAYLGIWLGENPYSERLRNQLLGGGA